MQDFTVGLGRAPWWVKVWGANPLVRRSDRVEAAVLFVAVLVTALAAPVAGALGTATHDARSAVYAEAARTRHQVTATAVDEGSAIIQPGTVSFVATATWDDARGPHREVIPWPDKASVGERQAIWVDQTGRRTEPPPPPSRAGSDALAVALSLWFVAATSSAGVVALLRSRLTARRYAEWDRAFARDHRSWSP